MTINPKTKLSHLRDIGWSVWDPIGLAESEGAWSESSTADEYDSYLLHAVHLLQRPASEDECTKYLMSIELEHMGLEMRDDTHLRATKTVQAIALYLATPPDDLAQLH